jgi:hypothetical protein
VLEVVRGWGCLSGPLLWPCGHSRLCVAVTSGPSSNIGLCESLDGADDSGCSPCWRKELYIHCSGGCSDVITVSRTDIMGGDMAKRHSIAV